MNTKEYYDRVTEIFRVSGDPGLAQRQMKYMRNKFEFYGLAAPRWLALSKEIYRDMGIPEGEDLLALARRCYEDDHREMHYFALETVQKQLKKQAPEFIHFLEELVLANSWWDTTDWLGKLVGIHFRRHPQLVIPVTERWMISENIWLQRVCLIFQLSYRTQTDDKLLFEYVRRLANTKEFFLQKAMGWALRRYADTNPEAVRHFIRDTALPPLTGREALKRMGQD